jgi:putative SOS response-associated peptidase YedK
MFSFTQALDELRRQFAQQQLELDFPGGLPNLEPHPSIRPTDPAAVIVQAGSGGALRILRWGFDRERGGPVINFRSDGRNFPSGRCLVPLDAFYEFTGASRPKSKWRFALQDEGMFCVAGLMRGDRFALLTMPPGPDIAPYHDRQIAILPPDLWARWLGPPNAQPDLPALPAGSLKVVQIR